METPLKLSDLNSNKKSSPKKTINRNI